jgi:hypothetical protein
VSPETREFARAEVQGLDFVRNRLPSTLHVNGHRAHYRARWIRCRNPICRSCPHGPYVYLVWRDGARVREQYVGRGADFR